ncbi:MAG: GDP-mannose 4,6-dehydratase, partial [Patescibacteria group bacterium]
TDWEIVCPCSWRRKGDPRRIREVTSHHDPSRTQIFTHGLTVPFCEGDIRSMGEIEHIVNCASASHVATSIVDPANFIRNNVNIAISVMELTRIIKPRKLVQISTDEVYGAAADGQSFPEWSPAVPSNPYSASKAAQEAIGISYWRTYDTPLTITNTVNNFGERQDPEKFVAKAIRHVFLKKELPIHAYGGVPSRRFYLHAENHASAVLHILRTIDNTPCTGHNLPNRFNVSSMDEYNNLEMAQIVAAIIGEDLIYRLEDAQIERKGHDGRYALAIEKLERTGWKAPYGFAESIQKYVTWTIDNKRWL